MGSCCAPNSNLLGEQFVRDILADQSLKIRYYTYIELLNEVVSKRVEQEIPKEHIKKFLIQEFYDEKKTESNDIYIDSIFNYILEQLNDKNNMYTVIIYFYPFIKHDNEKVSDNFFNFIRFISQSHKQEVKKEDIQNILFKYISFCTRGITQAIQNKLLPGDDMNNSFKSLLDISFSEERINNFIDKLICILTENSNDDIVSSKNFGEMFQKYDISTIEKVRDFLLA
jgi:hypothetical protein